MMGGLCLFVERGACCVKTVLVGKYSSGLTTPPKHTYNIITTQLRLQLFDIERAGWAVAGRLKHLLYFN